MTNPLVEALKELVELKDLKDEIDRTYAKHNPIHQDMYAELTQKQDDYKKRKPIAWEAARQAIADFESQPSGWMPCDPPSVDCILKGIHLARPGDDLYTLVGSQWYLYELPAIPKAPENAG